MRRLLELQQRGPQAPGRVHGPGSLGLLLCLYLCIYGMHIDYVRGVSRKWWSSADLRTNVQGKESAAAAAAAARKSLAVAGCSWTFSGTQSVRLRYQLRKNLTSKAYILPCL